MRDEMADVDCITQVIEGINSYWLIYKKLDFVPWVKKIEQIEQRYVYTNWRLSQIKSRRLVRCGTCEYIIFCISRVISLFLWGLRYVKHDLEIKFINQFDSTDFCLYVTYPCLSTDFNCL